MDGRSQPLNAKDTQSFQLALTLYEKKEYAKAQSEVDAILRRRKERVHGESLCLKGLIEYHISPAANGDSARALLEQGTQVDSKSPVAWHMRGIFHKLRKEYPEAHAAYLKSYGLKKDNPNVHQDLAMLAAQLRDYRTLVEVRQHALAQRMSFRMSWTALVAALFLRHDYAAVEKTVALYEQLMAVEQAGAKPKPAQEQLADEIEISELLMLRNRAIMEIPGQEQRALADLDAISPRVRDRLALEEHRARLLAKREDTAADAERAYLALLERNADNAEYYKALEQLQRGRGKPLSALYDSLEQRFPRADLPLSRALLVLEPGTDARYAERVAALLRRHLARGAPSTFMLVRGLYGTPKETAVAGVVEEITAGVGSGSGSADSGASGASGIALLLLRAHHLSHTARQSEAVALLRSASAAAVAAAAGDDDKIDLELALASLLQRAGAFAEAAELLGRLSEANLGDRYLNTKAAEAYFLANDAARGYEEAFRFPRWGKHAESEAECLQHLVAMESVDVLLAAAEAHARRREPALALKRAWQVVEVFHSYEKEQYDFHFYGPKRCTLRQYVDMVHWGDRLYGHPSFVRAVRVAAGVLVERALGVPDGLSEAERQAAKRQRAKALDGFDLKQDADPLGVAFYESAAALPQLFEEHKRVELQRSEDPSVFLTGVHVLLAQRKYVLAIQALKRAAAFGATPSQIALAAAVARHTLDNDAQAPQAVRQLQLRLLPTIAGADVAELPIQEFVDQHVLSFVEWVRARVIIGAVDGLETACAERVDEICTVEELRSVREDLRRVGLTLTAPARFLE